MLRENEHYRVGIKGDYERPTAQRHLAFFLMDRLFYSPFSWADIEKINLCRLYLEVLTLADIASGDGSTVEPDYYNGQRSAQRRSRLKWPRQANPPPPAWRLWRLAIDTLWSNNREIQPPLETWLTAPIQRWTWYHDAGTNSLYEQRPDNTLCLPSSLDIHRRHRT